MLRLSDHHDLAHLQHVACRGGLGQKAFGFLCELLALPLDHRTSSVRRGALVLPDLVMPLPTSYVKVAQCCANIDINLSLAVSKMADRAGHPLPKQMHHIMNQCLLELEMGGRARYQSKALPMSPVRYKTSSMSPVHSPPSEPWKETWKSRCEPWQSMFVCCCTGRG